MKLTSPSGQEHEIATGTKVWDLLQTTVEEIPKDIIGIRLNDERLDLQSPVTEEGSFELILFKEDSDDAKYFYRHSMSHVLAQAVKRLFPEAKLAIGPAIADGFYYDFDVEKPFTPEDLEAISKEMKKIIKENHRFERQELSPGEARKRLEETGEIYKLELFDQFADRGDDITFYQDGEFVDLCRGPHIKFSNQVKHFKLLDVAGAYWRGDEKNKMLQRIYGTAYQKKEDLEQHLWRIEEAKKRDHRRLGVDLDLFSVNAETIGGGLILWHPKGGLMRHLIESHCKDRHLENGYDFVYSPHIGRSTLWETSGHLSFYKDGMFAPIDIDGNEYYLKPMNCPFHANIFASKKRSYRELPLRFAEWGTVYRWERSGVLHGLTRVRGFTQDDAHLFCREDQMSEEIDKVLNFSLSILADFGLENFEMFLSTRPEKRVGEEKQWDAAEKALNDALDRSGLPYTINEADGAFYGPKIDVNFQDAIGRKWQLATIQFDFNLPERFKLNYIGEDGKEHRPYMIHRALLGSLERFFGILIEHYGGAFPVWLSPVQAVVIPIAERHHEYASKVAEQLSASGLRVHTDASSNTLNYRIRNAQTQKTPYMLVIGDREQEAGGAAVRIRTGEDLGTVPTADIAKLLQEKIENKELP